MNEIAIVIKVRTAVVVFVSNLIAKNPLAIIIPAPPKAISMMTTMKPKATRKLALSSWKKMCPRKMLLIKR